SDQPGVEAALQGPQRGQVAMVVVIVAQEHEVDLRQVIELDTRCGHSAGAGEAQWAGALGIHRIGQQVAAAGLYEEGGVADEGHDHLVWTGRPRRTMRLHRYPLGPRGAPGQEKPGQSPERLPIGSAGVEELPTVEVVRNEWGGEQGHEVRTSGSPGWFLIAERDI